MTSIFIQGESNKCSSFPCYNGGSCTPASPSYFCTCKPPYAGNQCQFNNNSMFVKIDMNMST